MEFIVWILLPHHLRLPPVLVLAKASIFQGVGIDTAIFRIVGDGSAPPMLRSHGVSRALRMMAIEKVTEMLFESELEQPLR